MPLRVVVLPATGTSRPAPPLFYLAGYNGDSAGFGDAVRNGLDWAARHPARPGPGAVVADRR
jgi:hypothetical protein